MNFLYWLWHTPGALILTGTVAVIACGAVAWFIPPLRRTAIGVGAVILAGVGIYAKGAADARRKEKEKSQEAVNDINKKYDEIDARPNTPTETGKRLEGGSF